MPNKLDELIPTKLFDNPIPLNSHWESFKFFVKAVVPSTTIGILSFVFASLSAQWRLPDAVVYLFVLLGVAMLAVDVYAVFVFEDERIDKQWRRNTYNQQLTIINLAIQNLTIINKANTVNMIAQSAPPSPSVNPKMLYPEVSEEINAAYSVAKVMTQQGIGSWKLNGNKRPKIKPISFDAIVKLIETGHPRWQEACQMLDDAKIFINSSDKTKWQPIVLDETTAISMLDVFLISQGYYQHMKNNQPEWRRALPQGVKWANTKL